MERHSRAYDRFKERMNKDRRKRFEADGGLLFNDSKLFNENDRDAMTWIYTTKLVQGEFDERFKGDYRACMNEVARLYLAQKCAFQDVLTKESFDATEEVLRDYDGKIAALSNHGTLMLFGRDKGRGRLLTMKRIHTPKYDATGALVTLPNGLKIGNQAYMVLKSGTERDSSILRGLACKLNGSGDDEIDIRAQQTLVRSIDETYEGYKNLPIERLVEMSVH